MSKQMNDEKFNDLCKDLIIVWLTNAGELGYDLVCKEYSIDMDNLDDQKIFEKAAFKVESFVNGVAVHQI
jgi:hypothetical protein